MNENIKMFHFVEHTSGNEACGSWEPLDEQSEMYHIDKNMVWEQIHQINEKMLDEKVKRSDITYLTGMLRVWECVISDGESVPDLSMKHGK